MLGHQLAGAKLASQPEPVSISIAGMGAQVSAIWYLREEADSLFWGLHPPLLQLPITDRPRNLLSKYLIPLAALLVNLKYEDSLKVISHGSTNHGKAHS